jgi:hypothetical protein
MSDRATLDAKQLLALSGRLQRAPRVVRLAKAADSDTIRDLATEAAHGLADIQHSCDALFNQLVPKLNAVSPESPDFDDVLNDIAEEYRHIYYHIVNTRLFNYVVEGGAPSVNGSAH